MLAQVVELALVERQSIIHAIKVLPDESAALPPITEWVNNRTDFIRDAVDTLEAICESISNDQTIDLTDVARLAMMLAVSSKRYTVLAQATQLLKQISGTPWPVGHTKRFINETYRKLQMSE